mmetsp:Transcript_10834/g.34405  ORF Transcript_10834/g.34405 Transcript_10834/m.34405 type:complete len:407 (+) Transcript_10834:2564-3784(+)
MLTHAPLGRKTPLTGCPSSSSWPPAAAALPFSCSVPLFDVVVVKVPTRLSSHPSPSRRLHRFRRSQPRHLVARRRGRQTTRRRATKNSSSASGRHAFPRTSPTRPHQTACSGSSRRCSRLSEKIVPNYATSMLAWPRRRRRGRARRTGCPVPSRRRRYRADLPPSTSVRASLVPCRHAAVVPPTRCHRPYRRWTRATRRSPATPPWQPPARRGGRSASLPCPTIRAREPWLGRRHGCPLLRSRPTLAHTAPRLRRLARRRLPRQFWPTLAPARVPRVARPSLHRPSLQTPALQTNRRRRRRLHRLFLQTRASRTAASLAWLACRRSGRQRLAATRAATTASTMARRTRLCSVDRRGGRSRHPLRSRTLARTAAGRSGCPPGRHRLTRAQVRWCLPTRVSRKHAFAA